MAYKSITVTDTATEIVVANTQRQSLILQNVGSENLYIGSDNGITTGNAILLSQNGSLIEESGGTRMYMGDIWGITTTGNSIDVRYWERTR